MRAARNTTAAHAAATALLALAAGCSFVFAETVRGSGTRVDEDRPLAPFHAVRVEGTMDVQLAAGRAPRVRVSADDNQLAYVETEVDEGVLRVRLRPGFELDPPAAVALECDRLESLELAGSGRVDLRDVSGDTLRLRLAGSADLSARGAVDEIDVEIAGSADVDLLDLRSERARVRVAGSGDVRVHAEERLDVRVAGSGDVRYRGRPEIERSIVGSGAVEPAD